MTQEKVQSRIMRTCLYWLMVALGILLSMGPFALILILHEVWPIAIIPFATIPFAIGFVGLSEFPE